MCSPKGASFLYAKRSCQEIIDPLVVSWGYDAERPSHSQFLDYLQWQGTNDVSAYLTVPETINFLEENKWNDVRSYCRDLNLWARELLMKELSIDSLCSEEFLGQMTSLYFPFNDVLNDQIDFYKKYNIQIPFVKWNKRTLFRISIQVYNTKEDVFKLLEALKHYKL